jgi:hypothetical protein
MHEKSDQYRQQWYVNVLRSSSPRSLARKPCQKAELTDKYPTHDDNPDECSLHQAAGLSTKSWKRREKSCERREKSCERREKSWKRREKSCERREKSWKRREKSCERREKSCERREQWTHASNERTFRQAAKTNRREEVDGEARVPRVVAGEQALEVLAEEFVFHAGLGSPRKCESEQLATAATCITLNRLSVDLFMLHSAASGRTCGKLHCTGTNQDSCVCVCVCV